MHAPPESITAHEARIAMVARRVAAAIAAGGLDARALGYAEWDCEAKDVERILG